MKATQKTTTLSEAHRIASEMKKTGKSVGYSWSFDTVRWLLRNATPEGMVVWCDSHNTETANYSFRRREW
jgi:hypothetical protein